MDDAPLLRRTVRAAHLRTVDDVPVDELVPVARRAHQHRRGHHRLRPSSDCPPTHTSNRKTNSGAPTADTIAAIASGVTLPPTAKPPPGSAYRRTSRAHAQPRTRTPTPAGAPAGSAGSRSYAAHAGARTPRRGYGDPCTPPSGRAAEASTSRPRDGPAPSPSRHRPQPGTPHTGRGRGAISSSRPAAVHAGQAAEQRSDAAAYAPAAASSASTPTASRPALLGVRGDVGNRFTSGLVNQRRRLPRCRHLRRTAKKILTAMQPQPPRERRTLAPAHVLDPEQRHQKPPSSRARARNLRISVRCWRKLTAARASSGDRPISCSTSSTSRSASPIASM